ncbi:hypothetical protein EXIGLDRAFT_776035 [Exidia glandulosa HHB12029]|uniref:Fungal N-terminal domain-containing protein n=1 Tax=Exidia glandulosa HHB12029 TaxID=1314781 RepID=A0A165DMY8_EXIGL|nr:hypothetical protein EXIGLDRAFT_776035 [Exidia glandulosa HHB12029]
MPVFAFTVGSLGDILAVLQLAWEIRQNLSDAAGASNAIQALVREIDAFALAVEGARSVLERSQSVPPSLRNSVAFILANCAELLREVQKKIAVRRQQVLQDQGASAWSAIWAACAWTFLGGERDIECLRRRLAEQHSALQMIFTAYQSSALHAQEDNFVEVWRGVRLLIERLPARVPNDIPPFVFFNEQGYGVEPLADVPFTVSTHGVIDGD